MNCIDRVGCGPGGGSLLVNNITINIQRYTKLIS
jgi:hypothetical protein